MGKELSMARPEEGNHNDHRPNSRRVGVSELLVGSRPRLPVYSSSSRDKRKEATTVNKGTERGTAEDTTPASPISAEAEILHGTATKVSKRGRRSRNNKAGKPDTGAKGTNSKSWRSASELGIKWIGDFCQDHQPHYLIATHRVSVGELFKCQNCHQHIWLPTGYDNARELDKLIDVIGPQQGYCKFLDKHQAAKVIVSKLQSIWKVKQENPSNGEFLAKVLEIMGDKEYGRNLD